MMMQSYVRCAGACFLLGAMSTALAAPWWPLVNNSDQVPGSDATTFQEYSAPSVDGFLTTVFRAQTADGTIAGVYARNLNTGTGVRGRLITIAQSKEAVPGPNDLGAQFRGFADFPRIERCYSCGLVATVGSHNAVVADGPTRLGQSGVYVADVKRTPISLSTAVGQLGSLPDFRVWQVPGSPPGTKFDKFSHASTKQINGVPYVVFRGEYQDGGPQHGVFYRALESTGTAPVVSLRDTRTGLIPGLTGVPFGYLSPPTAGGYDTAALTALDKPIDWTSTHNPSWGSVSKLHISKKSYFFTYVKLGHRVPGVKGDAHYNRFGDTVAWNGRFIAFWGSWGTAFKAVKMVCPQTGDLRTRRLCRARHPGNVNTPVMKVPVNQAIVVFDNRPKKSRLIDRTNGPGDDYVFWKYSVEDDSWRPSIQLAADSEDKSLTDPQTWVAFKMRHGELGADGFWSDARDHLYLRTGLAEKAALLVTGSTDGTVLDPNAAGMKVVGFDLERDGLRNKVLGIHARMKNPRGSEAWAGIYVSKVVP